MLAHAAAFLAVSALVIVTPGQDTALTIRNTLARGRRGGVHTAAGVALGQLVWALAASAGLAALLHAWEPAFLALRIAGAAYLLYLGLTALRSAFARRREPTVVAQRLRTPPLAAGAAEQPRQPEDGRLLHEPAAAVRAARLVRRAVRARRRLLHADAGLAERLRPGGLAGERAPAPLASVAALEALTGAVLVALGLRVAAEPPSSRGRPPASR